MVLNKGWLFVDIFFIADHFQNSFLGKKRIKPAERSEKTGLGNECDNFFWITSNLRQN